MQVVVNYLVDPYSTGVKLLKSKYRASLATKYLITS